MPIMCTCGQILHTLEQEFEHREHGNWIRKSEVKEAFKNCATIWDYEKALKELIL